MEKHLIRNFVPFVSRSKTAFAELLICNRSEVHSQKPMSTGCAVLRLTKRT